MNLCTQAMLRRAAGLAQHGLPLILGLCLLLPACSASSGAVPTQDAPIFRAPTSVPQTPLVLPQPTLSPTPDPIQANPRPSATPACSSNLRFLEDLTVPDGSQVAPGAAIDKRWKVENTGTCNWDERYRLRLIEGPNLGAPQEQALYPARGSTQAEIRMIFTAPTEPGIYRSAWQAFDPQGQAFGEMIYIQITVLAPSSV